MRLKHAVPALASLALTLACPQQPPPQPPTQPDSEPPQAVVIKEEHSLVPALGPETWVGTVTLLGASLAVIARLEPDPDKPGTWRGRLDIPMQGLKDFPLQDVDVTPEGLVLRELAPGVSAREVQEKTEPTLRVPADVAETKLA